ncbi:hypothetical protein [Merismopedia glauca]|uniref:Uncharacterized protein n=1 Tax=Merismopedia glauca CCAP 1448/3 TaxID=1296344 RepID=A0A2T1C9E3_9CYAN|nr:hypothetical protein [Merismopedia glauca]PSB04861.1 hypothetical protein C7B64_01870 [Merismopedia glauca CCAP 1448/3]
MSDLQPEDYAYARIPARVLGCLNNGEITVIIFPGGETFLEEPFSIDFIPPDLRMPNSEFDILTTYPGAEIVRILRKDEACPEIDLNSQY